MQSLLTRLWCNTGLTIGGLVVDVDSDAHARLEPRAAAHLQLAASNRSNHCSTPGSTELRRASTHPAAPLRPWLPTRCSTGRGQLHRVFALAHRDAGAANSHWAVDHSKQGVCIGAALPPAAVGRAGGRRADAGWGQRHCAWRNRSGEASLTHSPAPWLRTQAAHLKFMKPPPEFHAVCTLPAQACARKRAVFRKRGGAIAMAAIYWLHDAQIASRSTSLPLASPPPLSL